MNPPQRKKLPGPAPGFRGFNTYSAGVKRYGAGRTMPNIGPVMNLKGYKERDNQAQAKKNAILRRLKGQKSGNPLNNKMVSANRLRGGY